MANRVPSQPSPPALQQFAREPEDGQLGCGESPPGEGDFPVAGRTPKESATREHMVVSHIPGMKKAPDLE